MAFYYCLIFSYNHFLIAVIKELCIARKVLSSSKNRRHSLNCVGQSASSTASSSATILLFNLSLWYSLYTKHKVQYNVWLLYKLSQPTTMSRYSLDFRKKIVEAYEKGDTSIRKVAKRFLVSPDTVRRLVKQYRLTGDLSPRKCGTKKKSIWSQHEEAVIDIVEAHPDLTLWQYSEKLREKLGINVSTTMIDRFLKQHDISLKKNIQERKSSNWRSTESASRLLGKN